MQKELVAQGLEPVTDSSPDKAHAYLLHEIGRWTPLIKSLGLRHG